MQKESNKNTGSFGVVLIFKTICLKEILNFLILKCFFILQRVFELHGAVQVNAPQLLPKSSLRIYDRTDKLVVGMSKSGDVTCLPFDLRVPFARYIARTKTNNMRRYCIAPVNFDFGRIIIV